MASTSDSALPPTDAAPPKLLWWAVLLVALTIVAYIPALGAGWIWDDDSYVTHNRLLAHDVPFQEALRLIWTPGNTPQYYPIVFTSFLLESRLYGSDFTNVPVSAMMRSTDWLSAFSSRRTMALPTMTPSTWSRSILT